MFNGVVVGIVKDNVDPEKMHRILVEFPVESTERKLESYWCRMASPNVLAIEVPSATFFFLRCVSASCFCSVLPSVSLLWRSRPLEVDITVSGHKEKEAIPPRSLDYNASRVDTGAVHSFEQFCGNDEL